MGKQFWKDVWGRNKFCKEEVCFITFKGELMTAKVWYNVSPKFYKQAFEERPNFVHSYKLMLD